MRIELHFGDITDLKVDCIINAARPSLLGGGGVDGAIHKKAGIELKNYCSTLNGCETGQAVLTPGFNLNAKYIIHTVGPRVNPFNEIDLVNDSFLLKNCYENSLNISREMNFSEIAFPNISTGAYGFPKKLAAEISFNSVKEFLIKNEFPKKVIFSCYDIENHTHFVELFQKEL
jgi:O-acetyl-ADP-ribose deacetylase (regulator of RNase III)